MLIIIAVIAKGDGPAGKSIDLESVRRALRMARAGLESPENLTDCRAATPVAADNPSPLVTAIP